MSYDIEYLQACLCELAEDIAANRAGKIHAIKAWRAGTGASLKDSKDFIEGISLRAEAEKAVEASVSRLDRLEQRVTAIESNLQARGNLQAGAA